jgi:hypothetical protein
MLDQGGGKPLDRNHKRVAVVAMRALKIDRPRRASQGVGAGRDVRHGLASRCRAVAKASRGGKMKFEFLVLDARLDDRKSADLERDLNNLGNDGWELVATFGLHNGTFVLQRVVAEAAASAKTRGKKQA